MFAEFIKKLEHWMFDNIGAKIKRIAKVTAFVEIIASIIGGIVMLFSAFAALPDSILLLFLAPFAVLAGCIAAWLSVVLIYAFGELVERITNLDDNLHILSASARAEKEERTKRETEQRLKYEMEQQAQQQAELARRKAELQAQREAEEQAWQEADLAKREARKQAILEAEQRAKVPAAKKEKTLAEKLAYALEYQTDEGMIRYLRGINDELVTNILKEPDYMIRDLVKKALETM